MLLVPAILIVFALVVASYTDIRTREVPDLVSHGMVYAGIGIGMIMSLVSQSWTPLIHSVAGFALGFLIGAGMFYGGQWGGGDAKIMMGIGSLLGVSLWNLDSFDFIQFFINCLIVGAFYGVIWSFSLVMIHPKKFVKRLKEYSIKKPIVTYRRIILTFAVIGIIATFLVQKQWQIWTFGFTAVIYVMFYLILFIKVVEKTFLIKEVDPKILTEGDWVARNVVVNRKVIAGPKDLGVTKEQIRKLIQLKRQKRIKTVLLKEGVPFVPSFLIAFLLLLCLGNWILNILMVA